jgi:hypothetical protein
VLSSEAANSNFMALGLTQPNFKPLIYCTRVAVTIKTLMWLNVCTCIALINMHAENVGLVQSIYHFIEKATCSPHDIAKKKKKKK